MTEKEFTQRLEETRKRLYLIALTVTKNKEDAEDAVSNAVLRALKKYGGFTSEDNFDGYMVTLTANEAKRIRSKRRCYDDVFELEDLFEGDDTFGDLEFFDLLDHAGLSVSGRKILILHFLYGYTLAQCAKIVRMAESSAKAEYYKSLDKIRKTVDKK